MATAANDQEDITSDIISDHPPAPTPVRSNTWQQRTEFITPPMYIRQNFQTMASLSQTTVEGPLPPEMDLITETFNIILQKGIEDGISFFTAKVRYIITRAPKSHRFLLTLHERLPGKNELQLIVSRTLKVPDYVKSIIRLQEILRDIPVQYVGAEDMYGRDTSIVQATDPTKTWDLHKSGPEAAVGIPHPTEEQKVLFDEAVRIIEKWGNPSGPSE